MFEIKASEYAAYGFVDPKALRGTPAEDIRHNPWQALSRVMMKVATPYHPATDLFDARRLYGYGPQ